MINNKHRVCVCVCVCVCACVCVFTSIHSEGFICLDQLECQGTDQRCFAEKVSFIHFRMRYRAFLCSQFILFTH